jgi:integrase
LLYGFDTHELFRRPRLHAPATAGSLDREPAFDRHRSRSKRQQLLTPHVLRHTAAGRWLDAGGSEPGLMHMFGWERRDMIDRYTGATSQRRAISESRKLNLGDW